MTKQEQIPEGLAGMIAENSHKIPIAKLPNQPVPPNSLTGVVQVQPSTGAAPPMSQSGAPPGEHILWLNTLENLLLT